MLHTNDPNAEPFPDPEICAGTPHWGFNVFVWYCPHSLRWHVSGDCHDLSSLEPLREQLRIALRADIANDDLTELVRQYLARCVASVRDIDRDTPPDSYAMKAGNGDGAPTLF